jgi:NAD-dependent dihydropyrimidine dehydrogenase PreA subunit
MAMSAFAERIRSMLPPHQHSTATDYVLLDRRQCEACWECVSVCPNGVLGAVSIGPHRHAVVERPEDCTGCLACAKVCESGALIRHEQA